MIEPILVRVRRVTRYVVLFMKNIILSTACWCKALFILMASEMNIVDLQGYLNLYVAVV